MHTIAMLSQYSIYIIILLGLNPEYQARREKHSVSECRGGAFDFKIVREDHYKCAFAPKMKMVSKGWGTHFLVEKFGVNILNFLQ